MGREPSGSDRLSRLAGPNRKEQGGYVCGQHFLKYPLMSPSRNDVLGRKTQIEALTRFVGNVKGPCVLAVDGVWGPFRKKVNPCQPEIHQNR